MYWVKGIEGKNQKRELAVGFLSRTNRGKSYTVITWERDRSRILREIRGWGGGLVLLSRKSRKRTSGTEGHPFESGKRKGSRRRGRRGCTYKTKDW